MIPLSLNEIESSARKGAVALGWPYGIAEEVGRAAVWAAWHCPDAVHSLLDMIETANTEPERPVDPKTVVFRQATVTSVVAGFDVLAAGCLCEVRFRAAMHPLGAAALGGGLATVYRRGFELRSGHWIALVDAGGCRLRGSRGQEATLSLRIASQPASHCAKPPSDGIELDQAAWARLEELASRSFVPATRISREAGAGAGLTDSD